MIPRAQNRLLLNAVMALKEVGLTESDIASKLEYDSVSELRMARTQARIALGEIEVPKDENTEKIRLARIWVDSFREEHEKRPSLKDLTKLHVLQLHVTPAGPWQVILQAPEDERYFYIVLCKPHIHARTVAGDQLDACAPHSERTTISKCELIMRERSETTSTVKA